MAADDQGAVATVRSDIGILRDYTPTAPLQGRRYSPALGESSGRRSQIFKETAKITKTASWTKVRPFKPWPQLQKEALERMMIKVEYAILYGVKAETTGPDGEALRTTAGIRSLLSTNVVDFSAGVDLDTFEDAMETLFKYGSQEKAMFCGNRAINIINRMVSRNTSLTYDMSSVDKKQTYGLDVTRLKSPFGIVNMIPHPLLTQSTVQTKDCIILDMKYLDLMIGEEIDWEDNVQLPDEHAKKGMYVGELGLSLALEEVHGYWYGLNSYVA